MGTRILVVDDEQIIRESLSFVLKQEGYEAEEASNGAEALRKHELNSFDLIITDIEMPEMKGTALLESITKSSPETFVMIITAFASIETAVQALRLGAYDYILKPIEFDDLLHRIRKLIRYRALALENSLLRRQLSRTYNFDKIIGTSDSMRSVFEKIKRVAHNDSTVLITGKSGTGKELIARAIHYTGIRKEKPFVPVNCGAIVDTLFESEMFGHTKGSFTGAVAEREGYFKIADQGTIFLDEVGELPLPLQVKLLRVIEQKEIIPVGKSVPLKVNVRVLAATNKNLGKEVEAGRFRDDLYYRLNVVEIALPSLSERSSDIPLLANHFLEVYTTDMNKRIKGFSNAAMALLVSAEWKGEIRELENVIERATIFCDEELITPGHFPDHVRPATPLASLPSTFEQHSLKVALKKFERSFIEHQLTKHDLNKEATAKALDVSLSSLYRKLEELGIQK